MNRNNRTARGQVFMSCVGLQTLLRMRGIGYLWLTMLLLLGCSNDLKKYSISGKATFAGKPIEKGEITFAPAAGAGRPDSSLFSNGAYQVSVTAGKKVVRISAWSTDPALVGPPPPDMPKDGINPDREYLPARYNENSTLEVEVLPQRGQNFNFELTKEPL